MITSQGHLTYCSNIHSGENWPEHFAKLREHIPLIKRQMSPEKPFGIGLRLSDTASVELRKEINLLAFQQWLQENDAYVFTMNGFPYGNFHHTIVKDQVHAPDWSHADRVNYTMRLAQILAGLLPEGMEGGISTSPLSYKFWHDPNALEKIFETATLNLLLVVAELIEIKRSTGKLIHIDIEPEPDGLLGNGSEFLVWYIQYLLPLGIPFLQDRFELSRELAEATLKEHIQLCYDVCHFAVGFEDHQRMISLFKGAGIKIGKVQISAALKASLPAVAEQRISVIDAFRKFNEPIYLHQVVARQKEGLLKLYPDMNDALADAENKSVIEWRAHFHVPIFINRYGVLESTQKDIEEVLLINKNDPFTTHLEIETYTWEVLPEEIRLPLTESIVREMRWVIELLNRHA